MRAHTGPIPHWVEVSSMGSHTGSTLHMLERIALWRHILDQHHTGLGEALGGTH